MVKTAPKVEFVWFERQRKVNCNCLCFTEIMDPENEDEADEVDKLRHGNIQVWL